MSGSSTPTPSTITPQICLVLASGSPRRRELLTQLGLPFVVVSTAVPEFPTPGEPPEATARRLALAKAQAALASLPPMDSSHRRTVVIGADTIVVADRRMIGKPRDRSDAIAILKSLRARTHQVLTAVAIVDPQVASPIVLAESTDVTLRPLSDDDIADYVATGDPLDKAGAYAIQNPKFHPVAAIRGCYSNVVGLPLCALAGALSRLGIEGMEGWMKTDESCRCSERLPVS